MNDVKAVHPELANRMAGKSMHQLILASVLEHSVCKEPIKCQQPKNTSTYSPKIIQFIQLSSTARYSIVQNCTTGNFFKYKKNLNKTVDDGNMLIPKLQPIDQKPIPIKQGLTSMLFTSFWCPKQASTS